MRQAAACARLQELCRAQHAAARSAEGAAAAAAAAQRTETARVEALVASVQRKCAPGPRALLSPDPEHGAAACERGGGTGRERGRGRAAGRGPAPAAADAPRARRAGWPRTLRTRSA